MKANFLLLLAVLCCRMSLAQLISPIEIVQTPVGQKEMFPMDMDGDGDLDILTTNGGGISELLFPDGHYASEFRLSVNDGAAVFAEQALFTIPAGMLWAFGDTDGDLLLDFVYASDSNIYFRKNLGALSFSSPEMLLDIATLALDCSDPANEDQFYAVDIDRVCIGDVDTDGDGDIVYESKVFNCFQTVTYELMYTGVVNALPWVGTDFGPNLEIINSTSIYDANNYHASFEDIASIEIFDHNEDGLNDLLLLAGYDASPWDALMFYNSGLSGFQGWLIGPNNSEIAIGRIDDFGYVELVGSQNYFCDQGCGSFWRFHTLDQSSLGTNEFYMAPSGSDGTHTPSASFLVMDLFNDGTVEPLSINYQGLITLFNKTWNSFGDITDFTSSLFNTGIDEVSNLRSGYMDNDDIEDLLIMKEGHIYMMKGTLLVATGIQVHVQEFYDTNLNGVMDVGEPPMPYRSITVNNQYQAFTNQFGEVNINLASGTYTLEAQPANPNVTFSNGGIATVVVDENSTNISLLFGVIPLGTEINSLQCNLNDAQGFCNSQTIHQIHVTNNGNTIANGVVSYAYDSLFTFSVALNVVVDSVSGNVLYWNYSDLLPGQSLTRTVMFWSPGSEHMGDTTTNIANASILDAMSNVLVERTVTNTEMITCAYDPNDITEHNGYTDSGYILDGDELVYTIRFQNTGNAPATNVRIENQLSELLQQNTLQPLAWSNDFELMIDENDRAIFTFSGINLPDSTNNEAESHGFITYSIIPITGLEAQTVISNTAEIYFDFNPAIVTNTEVNTIYDCNDLQQTFVSETSVCTGEEITCNSNAIWIESLTWSFNGSEVGTGNYMHTLDESGTLTMQASNSLCEYSQDFELVANAAEASFTSNGNMLTANDAVTYQWYLNGSEISGTTQQSYEIAETGNYSVMIVDENGCDDVSEQVMAIYTGITSYEKINIAVYPNPANDKITISITESLIGAGMKICNELGQEVWNSKRLTAVNTEVDCSAFSKGVYAITISNTRNKFVIE